LLADLLAAAEGRDREPEKAWQRSAVAIEVMFWHDDFTDAADLAEEVITDLAHAGSTLTDQNVPFMNAFLAADVHEAQPAAPRLRRLTRPCSVNAQNCAASASPWQNRLSTPGRSRCSARGAAGGVRGISPFVIKCSPSGHWTR
jgi:hypothetical protein